MEEFKWNLKFPVHLHHNTGEFVQLKKNPSQRFWGKNCPKSIQILLNPKYLNRAWKRGAALGAENSETKERWKSKFLDLKFLTDSSGSWGFWNSFSWSFRAKQSKFFFLIIPNCERENREEESELSPAPQEFPPKAQSSKSRRKSIQNQRNHPKTWTKKNPEFLICYLRSPTAGNFIQGEFLCPGTFPVPSVFAGFCEPEWKESLFLLQIQIYKELHWEGALIKEFLMNWFRISH